MKTTPILSLLFLGLTSRVGSETITIFDAEGFINISANVRNGIRYEGTTVLLGSDIDFSGRSDGYLPIGDIYDYVYTPFCGEFDGQGHVIRNFVLNSTERYVSLFGMINGTGFRNVVMDSSCSITDNYNFANITSYAGGLIAYIYPTTERPTKIEGCVSMASITFIGNASDKGHTTTLVSLGGIAGYLIPTSNTMEISNCVGYGEITYRGSSDIASLGGILGAFFIDTLKTSNKCHFRNCASFCKLRENGEVKSMLTMGGITGVSLNGAIENCISFEVAYNRKETIGLGKIVGAVTKDVTISRCYWTNEIGGNASYGYHLLYPPKQEHVYFVEPNQTVMNDLNSWVSSNGEAKFSKWMMTHFDGGKMEGFIEDRLITLRKPTMSPKKEGLTFTYWCADQSCTEGEYTGSLENVTDLYAGWRPNNYTLTFDLGNGTLVVSIVLFNSTISYPDMDGMENFYGWNTTFERMPAHDLVIGPAPPPEKNLAAIAGGVIGGIAILTLVGLIILFFVLRKSRRDFETTGSLTNGLIYTKGLRKGRSTRGNGGWKKLGDISLGRGGYSGREEKTNWMERRGGENYAANERRSKSKQMDGFTRSVQGMNAVPLDSLYTRDYKAPPMLDALIEAGLSNKLARLAIDTCSTAKDNALECESPLDDFTAEDAAAIAIYTFDFGPKKEAYNPYRLINRALMGEGDLEKVRGILHILLTALRKLPHSKGRLLYRGVKDKIRRDIYTSGNVVMWPSLSSTSPDMKAVKKFLAEEDEHDGSDDDDDDNEGHSDENVARKGTLFIIENAWGYNIQPYSLSPEQEEVLLEPKRQFQVESVIESETTVIKMTMLDTPLVLTQFIKSYED